MRGGGWIRLQAVQHDRPVHVREMQVEQDQVRQMCLGKVQAGAPLHRRDDCTAGWLANACSTSRALEGLSSM